MPSSPDKSVLFASTAASSSGISVFASSLARGADGAAELCGGALGGIIAWTSDAGAKFVAHVTPSGAPSPAASAASGSKTNEVVSPRATQSPGLKITASPSARVFPLTSVRCELKFLSATSPDGRMVNSRCFPEISGVVKRYVAERERPKIIGAPSGRGLESPLHSPEIN